MPRRKAFYKLREVRSRKLAKGVFALFYSTGGEVALDLQLPLLFIRYIFVCISSNQIRD